MRLQPRLSKSRYLAGLQCSRRLWLGWHDPEPRSEPLPGTVLAVGTDVGIAARLLVPGGILVDEGPDQHAQAVTRTRELIANPDVPAIFEAAFAFDNVLIRADILQRLPSGAWRLAEVKSTTRVKPEHLHDLAIQTYVITGCGTNLEQMQLVHVDTSYVRDENEIDRHSYFKPEDLTNEVRELIPSVPERVAEMHAVMTMPTAPEIRPSGHCFSPFECEFWKRCTADKPSDWIFYLPRLNATTFAELDGNRIESMREIPSDFPLTAGQQRVVDAVVSGREYISDDLGDALVPLGPPAIYLDFETFSPAVPLYAGTSPYQRIPFQWSFHHDDGSGELHHYGFLADGRGDPRRRFAKSLLEAILGNAPILVYSPYESSIITELQEAFLDLAPGLLILRSRMRDLLPVVRDNIAHPKFLGSYSIKVVAPILAPELNYDDLMIPDGTAASAAFYRLTTGKYATGETPQTLRQALENYCAKDTLAMVLIHRALRCAGAVQDMVGISTAHSPSP